MKKESSKKTKYSNMKMLYQNAVYKSLNLNQSPSTSSRGGSGSRDFSEKSRGSNSTSKYGIGVSRILEQKSNKIKFQVNNSHLSSERKTRLKSKKREASRDNSKTYSIPKKGTITTKGKGTISNKFFSPSCSKKMSKNKSRLEKSNEKRNLLSSGTDRSKYRESKEGKKSNFTILNPDDRFASKTQTLKETYKIGVGAQKGNKPNRFDKSQNDTFESHKSSSKKGRNEGKTISRRPENYKIKDFAPLSQDLEQDLTGNTLDSGQNSDHSSKYSKNPIKEWMEASAGGIRDKLDRYIMNGVIQDINCTDHYNKTALHYAAKEGRYKTVGYLLNLKIDPNVQTKTKKETALHSACRKGYKKIIVTLLNHNSNPNIQDSLGRTPLFIIAEQNTKDQIVAFINHCKFPIEWELKDNHGRKVYEVSKSREINRLLETYMKTASSQRFSRETRLYNKLNNRSGSNANSSRSKSRGTNSISKRVYKFSKYTSPTKSPNAPVKKAESKTGTNNILIHQTRNESVKRMFKNFNKTRAKAVAIRKKINIQNPKNFKNGKSGSKPNIKQERYEPNKSLGSQDNSYIKRVKDKTHRIDYKEKEKMDNLDRLLFEKSNEKEIGSGQLSVNKTKGRKEPKMGENRYMGKEQMGFSHTQVSNTRIGDYFDNARKISVEEEPSEIVPKIEISLNE